VSNIKLKQQRYNSMFGLALENPARMMTYMLHRICRLQLHLEKATVLTHSMYVTLMVQDSAWHQCTESNGKARRHARFMLFMQMPQRLHHVGTNNIKQIDCAYTLPTAFTARLFRMLIVKLRSLRSGVVPNKSTLQFGSTCTHYKGKGKNHATCVHLKKTNVKQLV